jgi:hypothetical protein
MADQDQPDKGQDTDESPAIDRDATQVGAQQIASSEGEQSPADADRAAQGLPQEPSHAPLHGAPREGQPTGTGPGGEVRGGYGVGATGPSGDTDVRGPSDTGGAGGGQSPAAAQRRADEEATDAFAEKPHLYVAGAFVGGLVLAQILKRLGGDD